MLLVFINLNGRKKYDGHEDKQLLTYNKISIKRHVMQETHGEPVFVDPLLVQKRRVSSDVRDPAVASFVSKPEKEKYTLIKMY